MRFSTFGAYAHRVHRFRRIALICKRRLNVYSLIAVSARARVCRIHAYWSYRYMYEFFVFRYIETYTFAQSPFSFKTYVPPSSLSPRAISATVRDRRPTVARRFPPRARFNVRNSAYLSCTLSESVESGRLAVAPTTVPTTSADISPSRRFQSFRLGKKQEYDAATGEGRRTRAASTPPVVVDRQIVHVYRTRQSEFVERSPR